MLFGPLGGKGFIDDFSTGNTSPFVVNQSAFPPVCFSHCFVKPWSRICTSMPVFGRLPGFKSSSAAGGAHTKIPELPPDCRCFHWATISKFVYCLLVRMTPFGLPVQ